MKISYYTVEVQRDSADFSDAKTTSESAYLEIAYRKFNETKGHRRLIGWLDEGFAHSPVELERV